MTLTYMFINNTINRIVKNIARYYNSNIVILKKYEEGTCLMLEQSQHFHYLV